MRRSFFFTVILATIILVSCDSDVEPPAPKPDQNEVKILEIERDLNLLLTVSPFPGGSILSGATCVITQDTVQKKIIIRVTNGDKPYEERFFDAQGRLVKILRKSPTWGVSDSLLITRRNPDVIEITENNQLIRRYRKNSLPGGKWEILEDVNGNGAYINRWVMNEAGMPETISYQSWGDSYQKRKVSYFNYSNGKFVSAVDTTFSSGAGVTARTAVISKDSRQNSYLISVFKKMVGADMEWILYDHRSNIAPFVFEYDYPGMIFLQNGAITSIITSTRVSADSIGYSDRNLPFDKLNFNIAYDANERMTAIEMSDTEKKLNAVKFHYPD